MTEEPTRRRPTDVRPRRKDRGSATRRDDIETRDAAPAREERRRMPDVGPARRPPIITLATLP
jgi:hypothetical protein